MSFKLRPEWGPVKCKMVDGVITVEDGIIEDIVIGGGMKGLTFEEQHTNFLNKPLQCYLENEKYVFVLRFDGSYTVYWKETGAICANGAKINKPLYLYHTEYEVTMNGGIIDSRLPGIVNSCWIVELNKRLFVFCDGKQLVGVDLSKNSYYYVYCKTNENPVKPDMIIKEDGKLYMESGISAAIEVEKFYNIGNETYCTPKGGVIL